MLNPITAGSLSQKIKMYIYIYIHIHICLQQVLPKYKKGLRMQQDQVDTGTSVANLVSYIQERC